jgi:hypothetical protein
MKSPRKQIYGSKIDTQTDTQTDTFSGNSHQNKEKILTTKYTMLQDAPQPTGCMYVSNISAGRNISRAEAE